MSEYTDLTAAIAEQIKDYRQGEIAPRTPEVVDRWASQFESNARLPLLKELHHVIEQTYWSREEFEGFLKDLISAPKLVGDSKEEFWQSATFLSIQKQGHSQAEILELFDGKLIAECGFSVSECGRKAEAFVYLDDAIFSGSRLKNDVEAWIKNEAPAKATLHVIAIASHTSVDYYVLGKLREAVKAAGKSIEIHLWRAVTIENQLTNKNNSEVLWPTELPDDQEIRDYAASGRFPFSPRVVGGRFEHGIFSGEEGRSLLEQQMLVAGMKIRSFCANPSDALRPLGFGPFGLGFGSTIMTFRNCANNCPLALWWGDPEASPSHPFSKWFPLLPRKTYETPAIEIDWEAFFPTKA